MTPLPPEPPTPATPQGPPRLPFDPLALLLRVGMFFVIAVGGLMVFGAILSPLGLFLAAALTSFSAAAVANAISLRIYEGNRMSHIGMMWNLTSRQNLFWGFGLGTGAALVVLVPPLLLGLASLQAVPNARFHLPSILFVALILLFGAIGEEMLFHGYAFQLLIRRIGPVATILPFSLLFGVAHMTNPNATALGMVNTTLWGLALGFAFLRSGDLWLPIGLHYGWNLVLPLMGVNLSGFTMGMTGRTLRWQVGSIWSGGDYGPEGGLLCTLAVLALLIALYRLPIRHQAVPME
jgi:membrane protease YdiL (CAAX protease family)